MILTGASPKLASTIAAATPAEIHAAASTLLRCAFLTDIHFLNVFALLLFFMVMFFG